MIRCWATVRAALICILWGRQRWSDFINISHELSENQYWPVHFNATCTCRSKSSRPTLFCSNIIFSFCAALNPTQYPSAADIESLKVGVVEYLSGDVLPANEIALHLIIASSDSRHTVATKGENELRRLNKYEMYMFQCCHCLTSFEWMADQYNGLFLYWEGNTNYKYKYKKRPTYWSKWRGKGYA